MDSTNQKFTKFLLLFLIVIPLSYFVSLLALDASKTSVGVFIMLLFILAYLFLISKVNNERVNAGILKLIIFTISFPYLIQFGGRDAFTVTTFIIYFLSAVSAIFYLNKKRKVNNNEKFTYILPNYILIGLFFSFILNLNFIGQSLRYYIANISGILLYFLIITLIKKRRDILKVLKIVLFSLFIQFIISFIQIKFPAIASIVITPFKDRYFFGDAPVVEGIIRATGTIQNYELLGEWFLIGGMISLFFVYNEIKNKRYYLYYFMCFAGLIFTKTRGAFLLFLICSTTAVIIMVISKKDKKFNSLKLVSFSVVAAFFLLLLFSDQIMLMLARLRDYFMHRDLLTSEAINRKQVWDISFKYYLCNPSFWGRGLYNVESLNSRTGSFHSLYLTLFYKTGFWGISAHLIFWFCLLRLTIRNLILRFNSNLWVLRLFLLICLFAILVDGIKIEYLRNSHTIQFAWMLFGLLIVANREDEYR